jgi:hypothetical protein
MFMRCSLYLLFLINSSILAADPPKAQAPSAPPDTQLDQKGVPTNLADWTPRPAQGKVEPWEKMTDKDWIDTRFREMNTGPFLDATFRYQLTKGQETIYKGTAIKLADGGVLFDRNSLRLAAVWSGGWLQHSDKRFGLLNTPTPIGTLLLANPSGPGWADQSKNWMTGSGITNPLPRDWAKYRGLYRTAQGVTLSYTVGTTELLEAYVSTKHESGTRIDRHIQATIPGRIHELFNGATLPGLKVELPPSPPTRTKQSFGNLKAPPSTMDWSTATKPATAQWGTPIVTKLVRGEENGPLAVDTLTIPYVNPFKALFFCTGVDTLSDGRIAVCTCHGDVWLVSVDEAKNECRWQRYATGLYHPLGLKVVDGKIFVLESGQLTRLHDLNGDGEADFYENFNNDWHTGSGEHSYDTCLEVDPQGNFYFFKTGDTNLPNGGCLMRVTKDGSKAEIFATGFRHPIGMGMSPTGIITGADQEGNWMPATRIDQYKAGGFYGDMRAHHRSTPPLIYDQPICWLPREVDNSAGGQVWVPEGRFGPLSGLPLHLSYGRCKPFILLRQEVNGLVQGGVWDLGIRFLAGSCRARFAADGNMYVCGLNGWQTAAQADGSLQRVRTTGKPMNVPIKMEVTSTGIELTFSQKLNKSTVEDPSRYRSAKWYYRWSGDYGSKRYKMSNPNELGQDDVTIKAAKLINDDKTIQLTIPGTVAVMQQQLGLNILAADGTPIIGSVYLTIHGTSR